MRTQVHIRRQSDHHGRRGGVLVVSAVSMMTMVSILLLLLETGVIMDSGRRAQSASDAAAMAAAQALLRRDSIPQAIRAGEQFAREFNQLGDISIQIDTPPATGPYAGRDGYCEAVVTMRSSYTGFSSLTGATSPTIQTRAVAGYDRVSSADMIIALDKKFSPGLDCVGNGRLLIDGGVITNSQGGGVDEYGAPVDGYINGYAGNVASNGTFIGKRFDICGGVNDPLGFQPWVPGNVSPLHCRKPIVPDPLLYLPTPTSATGVQTIDRGRAKVTADHVVETFYPGLYDNIAISGGTVTFMPGIYVIRGGELRITGGNVTGDGVMFYITLKSWDPQSGNPDKLDFNNPPLRNASKRGGVTITSDATLRGLKDPTSPYDGVLFYMRRVNDMPVAVAGNAQRGQITGTVYAKWSQLTLSGQGVFNTQFIVGNAKWAGNGDMTLSPTGYEFARPGLVYLVE